MCKHRSHRSIHPLRRLVSLLPAAAAGLVLAPDLAWAQACLGSAARTAQFTLGAEAAFAEGADTYQVESRANLPGRVSMGARLGAIELEGADDRITTAGVNLALDLGMTGVSLCPFVGPGYDTWSGTFAGVDLDYSRTTIPVGLGVGAPVAGNSTLTFIPSARAGMLHVRHSGSAEIGGGAFARTGTTTDPFFDAAATLLLGRLYARAGAFRVFEDEADTVFRLGVGVVF